MKKITLKIDGKEQTFNEGSVVEVTAHDFYRNNILGKHADLKIKYIGYVRGIELWKEYYGAKKKTEHLVLAKNLNPDLGVRSSRMSDMIPFIHIKSINKLK